MMSLTRVSNTENSAVSCNSDSGVGEIMLFGVRVVVDSMRKSVSLNNLSQYVHPENDKKNKSNNSNSNTVNAKNDVVADYASENDVAHNSCGNRERERKRGIPWTEEEHKLFLIGLQKVGKGDWRGISRNFVKTRTPTQVASHAQKYFLRRNNLNRRRRRSSLFDITTDSVLAIPMEEVHYQDNANHPHSLPPPPPEPCNASEFPLMPTYPLAVGPAVANVWIEKPIENLQRTLDYNALTKLGHPTTHPLTLHSKIMADLNLNLSPKVDPTSLSLKLSLPIDTRESMERQAAFQAMSSFNNGESSITVA